MSRRAARAGGMLGAAVLALVATPLLPAVAADTGTIEGRVLNETTGRPQPGIAVTLTGGRSGEETRKVVTDAGGRYRFTGLATGPDRAYALDARYAGGLFAGRAVTLPDDTTSPPVIDSTLRVWQTTTDPASIEVQRNDLFVVPAVDGAGIGVVESVTLANGSARAYIGRGGVDGDASSVAFSLPAGADRAGMRILEATIDVPEVVPLESLGGFGVTTAIPPGAPTRITFTYSVEGTAGRFDLSRRALYPVLEHSVYTQEPLTLESDRLERDGQETLGGEAYLRWSLTDALDAGDSVQAVAVAEAGLGPLLAGGAAAVLVAGALVGGIALVRRRRRAPEASTAPPPTDARSHSDLVVAIAELDLRYRGGEVSQEEWSLRRAQLKDELTRSPS